MHKAKIPNGEEFYYFTKDDVLKDLSPQEREGFLEVFSVMEKISKILEVDCPDLAISNSISRRNEYTGGISDMCAMLYSPTEIPEINNYIIMISLKYSKALELSGIIAHEMRHIWQDKYQPEINRIHAQGYKDSLYHLAEIDADGFAIAILVLNGISMDEAGGVVCPEEKKRDKKAYMMRIDKANELIKELKDRENERLTYKQEGRLVSYLKRLLKRVMK